MAKIYPKADTVAGDAHSESLWGLCCKEKPLLEKSASELCEGKNNHFISQTCSLQSLAESITWGRVNDLSSWQFKHQKKPSTNPRPCIYTKRSFQSHWKEGHLSWHMASIHKYKICNSKVLTLQRRMQNEHAFKYPDGLFWDTEWVGRRTPLKCHQVGLLLTGLIRAGDELQLRLKALYGPFHVSIHKMRFYGGGGWSEN